MNAHQRRIAKRAKRLRRSQFKLRPYQKRLIAMMREKCQELKLQFPENLLIQSAPFQPMFDASARLLRQGSKVVPVIIEYGEREVERTTLKILKKRQNIDNGVAEKFIVDTDFKNMKFTDEGESNGN